MSERPERGDPGAQTGPEFGYPNLFQMASRRIAYIPLFQSWGEGPASDDDASGAPEFEWHELRVETQQGVHRLPPEFLRNPLPRSFQERLDRGYGADAFSKCRLVGVHTVFAPAGYPDRLTVVLSETNYLDYLRSGEHLDDPLPDDPARTLRGKYAPAVGSMHDLSDSKLTNICGVGVFLITSDNKVIVSEQSEEVDVFPLLYSYSASGTMDWNIPSRPFTGDAASNREWLHFLHPFTQICRECNEELRHPIDPSNLRLFGLGIDAKKLYYQFSFYEHTSRSAQEIMNSARAARDRFEKATVTAVDFELSAILDLVADKQWEPAAEATLLSLCASVFGLDNVERALDPVGVHERWKQSMLWEWDRRAARPGELAVMSTRYHPRSRVSEASISYVAAVMDFLGDDVRGKDVLEVGAGTGRLTDKLLGLAGRLTCIDCSKAMLERNHQRLGARAHQVKYVCGFVQDYTPPSKHDVAVSSLVMIHNVDDWEFKRLAQVMGYTADTLFLFEHVEEPHLPHGYTRLRSEQELIGAFPDFAVKKRDEHSLFGDRVVFLKLERASLGSTKVASWDVPDEAGYVYDVALSYASEDRTYVQPIADALKELGVRVFYDVHEKADLWGENLSKKLADVYTKQARYCVVFVSQQYPLKAWTRREMRAARMRALQQERGYILPVRLDETKLPGLRGVASLEYDVNEIVRCIREKLGR